MKLASIQHQIPDPINQQIRSYQPGDQTDSINQEIRQIQNQSTRRADPIQPEEQIRSNQTADPIQPEEQIRSKQTADPIQQADQIRSNQPKEARLACLQCLI